MGLHEYHADDAPESSLSPSAAAARIGSAKMWGSKPEMMSCGQVSYQSMRVPVLHALSGVLGGHSAGVCPRSQWLRSICIAGSLMWRTVSRFFWDIIWWTFTSGSLFKCYKSGCAVILRNGFVLSCDFMYLVYVICLGRLFIGDWRRRHVGSKSYKEGGCKEKERG